MNIKNFVLKHKTKIFVAIIIIILIALVIHYSMNKEGFNMVWPTIPKTFDYSKFVDNVNMKNVWGNDTFKTSQMKLTYSTDFSGDTFSLDDKTAMWNIRNDVGNPSFKQVLSARVPQNVLYGKSSVTLLTTKNKDQSKIPVKYYTAGIRSNKKLHYGYYEATYKYSASPDIDNAFWLTCSNPVYEIDINEGFYPTTNTGTLHLWTPTHKSLTYFANNNGISKNDYNTYGLLYTPQIIAWYVNGKMVHRFDNTTEKIDQSMTVWFTSAVFDHGNINNNTIDGTKMNVTSFKYYT